MVRRVNLICPQCNSAFSVKKSHANKRKYCSRKCIGESYCHSLLGDKNPHWKGGEINKICQNCGKTFSVCPALAEKRKFCSKRCAGDSFRIYPKKEKKTIEKKKYLCAKCGKLIKKGQKYCPQCSPKRGQLEMIVCRGCGKLFIPKHLGQHKPYCSNNCRKTDLDGDRNPNWKGGIRTLNQIIRASDEYKNWRNEVFERDHYTCQECRQIGGDLHSHHIKSFSRFPELRFVVGNGRTLCGRCHIELIHEGNPFKEELEDLKSMGMIENIVL